MTPITVRQRLKDYEFTEWKRADEYHRYIQSRFASINEKETQIATDAKEADQKVADLRTKQTKDKQS